MQVFWGNVNVSGTDATFQVLPKVLHAVDVRLAIYILASGVIYSLVIVAALFQPL